MRAFLLSFWVSALLVPMRAIAQPAEPEIVAVDQDDGTTDILVRPSGSPAHLERVDLRRASGTTPPSCDSGELVGRWDEALTTRELMSSGLPEWDAYRACFYRLAEDATPAYSVALRGLRNTPRAWVTQRLSRSLLVELYSQRDWRPASPDKDVTSIVVVGRESEGEDVSCADPVLIELSREPFDALARLAAEDVADPPRQRASVRVELPRPDGAMQLMVCVRTVFGRLEPRWYPDRIRVDPGEPETDQYAVPPLDAVPELAEGGGLRVTADRPADCALRVALSSPSGPLAPGTRVQLMAAENPATPGCDGEPRSTLDADAFRALPPSGAALSLEIRGPDIDCEMIFRARACVRAPDGALVASTGAFQVQSGWACLARGTHVDTPRGQRKIEHLIPGDRLLGYGDGVTTVRVRRVARRIAVDVATLTLRDGRTLDATSGHLFYVEGPDAYVRAAALRPGMRLRDRHGAPASIRAITPFEHTAEVFDVTVDGPRSFFAEGVLVHNY